MNDKNDQSIFKGSMTVTFRSRELAEVFLNLKEVKYNDHTLLRQWYVDWKKEKDDQFQNKKNKQAEKVCLTISLQLSVFSLNLSFAFFRLQMPRTAKPKRTPRSKYLAVPSLN